MRHGPEPVRLLLHGAERRWKDLADAAAEALESEWREERLTKAGDHDHCDICFWRLTKDHDRAIGIGFRSGGRWLCEECHRHFVQAGDRCFICGGTLGDSGDKVQGCTLHPERKYRWYHHECYDRACGVLD